MDLSGLKVKRSSCMEQWGSCLMAQGIPLLSCSPTYTEIAVLSVVSVHLNFPFMCSEKIPGKHCRLLTVTIIM